MNFCRLSYFRNLFPRNVRLFSDKTDIGHIGAKYKVYEDKDADIILDAHEEQYGYPGTQKVMEERDTFEGVNLTRGVRGVFEIGDLVDALKTENAQNIFVAKVPEKLNYVDYIVAVNGKSSRHMQALGQYIRKLYKLKRHPGDMIPKIEGKPSEDWLALDLGNIALHIFSSKVRKQYDIDLLWAVGAEYDTETNKPADAITQMLENNVEFLKKLKTK